MILRGVAFFAGMFLLGATAHVTISATGGYWQPVAVLTMAIALGVGVGAIAIGRAWNEQRKANAIWLLVAILAGEAFGFLMTAERLVVGREASQAPLRAAQGEIARARDRVTSIERALQSIPTTSNRLGAAEADKARADKAVTDQSALPGCRENCRKLLEAQVEQAQAEVVSARGELDQDKVRLQRHLQEANADLRRMAPPPSASPLADRLGLPSWAIDLFSSALGSLAANGLGCGLIAFAVHRRKEETKRAVPPPIPAPEPLRATAPPRTLLSLMKRKSVAAYLANRTDRVPGLRVELGELYADYVEACRADGEQFESRSEFEQEFATICDKANIRTQGIGDLVFALDMKLVT